MGKTSFEESFHLQREFGTWNQAYARNGALFYTTHDNLGEVPTSMMSPNKSYSLLQAIWLGASAT